MIKEEGPGEVPIAHRGLQVPLCHSQTLDLAQLPETLESPNAAAIVEKADKGRPALEHVIDCLGDVGVTRQPGALGAHPSMRSVWPTAISTEPLCA